VHAEQVVDADRCHLDVVLAGREGVSGNGNWCGSRNGKAAAAQTEIVIFCSYRPVVRKSPFKATAHEDSIASVAEAQAVKTISDGVISPSAALAYAQGRLAMRPHAAET
jgi:hypothetical protein